MKKNINILLKEKFDSLKIKNSSYSLRAFSKRLNVHPAAMSEILRGKRVVSFRLADRIATCTLFNESERNTLLSLCHTKKVLPELSQQKIGTSTEIDLDKYYLVSEWYYYSILSLSETKNYLGTSKWISKRLGISERVAKAALKRLSRLGYFIESKPGIYRPIKASLTTTNDIPRKALRMRHEHNLEAARVSLNNDDVNDREFTFITMAIDKSKMFEAKKLIREFRDKLCAFLEEGEKSEVYELAIQLFPRTNIKQN